jgi:hypothetical protein
MTKENDRRNRSNFSEVGLTLARPLRFTKLTARIKSQTDWPNHSRQFHSSSFARQSCATTTTCPPRLRRNERVNGYQAHTVVRVIGHPPIPYLLQAVLVLHGIRFIGMSARRVFHRTLMGQVASRRGMNKGKQGLCPDLALARLSSPGSPWFPLFVIIFLTGLLSSQ